ncbi:MAG: aminopeptidase [Oscillospiraceae bacterium]|nr:aminopeptidase [Oscillospiraceae bacterium]MBQ2323657.1 aminopeptidase [Oscillospiraceae bacterium]MBQ5535909.1 aminopeptidase [Oscillospiraceae bacterium]
MSETKNEWSEKLLYAPKNGYDRLSAEEAKAVEAYCEDYKEFLNHGKTERLCVDYCVELAEARGFKAYQPGMKLKAGDKVYQNNRGKGIMLAVIGTDDLSHGANIGAAHTDSPRLDLKPRPVYEEAEMAYFKTHHYGGIRKYQWVTIPLELHGVVMLADGSSVAVHIGDKEGDPQFIINDLLPHLGREQGKKPLNEAIPSESLNLLIGSKPLEGEECSDRFKLGVLKLLNEKYGIVEEDFISAELEVVPAGKARDVGFDRSFISAYGHDDRVCAYAELAGIFAVEKPRKTAVCIFADKEEIGSEGVSGMQSQAFEWFMGDLCKGQGVDLRDCFANSFCLSADVTAAYDPNFADVYDKRNSAFINYGVGLCKYTGAGGKSGASDASAEIVGKLRKLLNDNGVFWQMAELGKTDAGGGGTVAKYMAARNIDTIDAGVPVLSMHAPYETVAKLDCYMTYKCMKTVFEQA